MKRVLKALSRQNICAVIGVTAFFAILGFVGACERGGSIAECAVKSAICLAILIAAAYIGVYRR